MLTPHPTNISVLLVDAHPVFRVGLRSVFQADKQIHVVAEAEDGQTAIKLASERVPNVVVLELDLVDGSAIPVIRTLKAGSTRCRVLVLTAHTGAGDILNALEAGADGYLPKSCPPNEVRAAVQMVHAGERVLDRIAITALVERATQRRDPSSAKEALSPRERDVLGWLATGATSKEIAVELGLRPKTVENHRARILDKLGAVNSAAAVRVATATGLIERESVQTSAFALS
jgi:DNA-binding NarL/FixJ family response regulator